MSQPASVPVTDTSVQLILPFLPPAPTDACPECGSGQFRLVWKAIRHPSYTSTASYVCDQCRHHWTGPATP